MSESTLRRVFLAVCLLAVSGAAWYVWHARGPATGPPQQAASSDVTTLSTPPPAPAVMYRSLEPGGAPGAVAVSPLPSPQDARFRSSVSCERVHFAAGRGVCLAADENAAVTSYVAFIFDERFSRRGSIPLTGTPIRARMSPDGRRAAVTVFERGHSYTDDGFSTRTSIIDASSGELLVDNMERFDVVKDGARFSAPDFNFWGVTFTPDGNRFYATLGSGGVQYLIDGDVDRRRAVVLRPGVECPSLSPDATRIAYKKHRPQGGWTLHVLTLATGQDRALTGETRSIDDQVEWLDDRRIVYHESHVGGTALWTLNVEGDDAPQLLLAAAYSPAVIR